MHYLRAILCKKVKGIEIYIYVELNPYYSIRYERRRPHLPRLIKGHTSSSKLSILLIIFSWIAQHTSISIGMLCNLILATIIHFQFFPSFMFLHFYYTLSWLGVHTQKKLTFTA
ncbi:hypothetical protein ACJX0J_024829 [Zea mays]